MPKPFLSDIVVARLQDLGARIRARRKSLGVNATAAAESAGMSRVTLHRIEKGEPSVAMGAWANLVAALGMDWQIQDRPAAEQAPVDRSAWVPLRVELAQYPQLRALAWQVHGADALSPEEAFGIYERNARHLDMEAMPAHEHELWQALQAAFSRGSVGV
jgi:transcriptional regulator with XRE-family HTH domain